MRTGRARRLFLMAPVVACFALPASAEREDMPPPPIMPSDIPLDLALQGAEASLAACARIDERVAVAVVDRAEHIRVLLVSDGYDRDWLQSVQRQAHTVFATGLSSGDYGAVLHNDPKRIIAAIDADLALQRQKKIDAPTRLQVTPGAVPVKQNGIIVGAVSVSGNSRHGTALGYEYMGPVEPCAAAGRDRIEAGLNGSRSH